jgi:hypothetical protein
MKQQVRATIVFLGVVSAFFVMSLWSGASYADDIKAKTNFEPSKRSMSFIKFMDAPENHGIRDMRSLKKRYARYRGGRFLVTDTGRSNYLGSGDKQ